MWVWGQSDRERPRVLLVMKGSTAYFLAVLLVCVKISEEGAVDQL